MFVPAFPQQQKFSLLSCCETIHLNIYYNRAEIEGKSNLMKIYVAAWVNKRKIYT